MILKSVPRLAAAAAVGGASLRAPLLRGPLQVGAEHRVNLMSSMMMSTTTKRPRIARRVLGEMGGGGSKVWSEITELARQPNVVADLGQGYPDFPGDALACAKAVEVIAANGRLNQYSLVNGDATLRASLSNYYAKAYASASSRVLDANKEVVITSSGTESLYAAITALVEPGDEVVVFEPCFPWYAPDIRLAGGVMRCVPLRYPTFEIDEAALRAACNDKTRLIILNSPHNPTGHMAREREMKLVAEMCKKHDAFCISDEVYETFVFDPSLKHLRMCDQPDMWDRTLTVGTASKMFSLTGWRVGWLYGPEDLISASRAIHSFASYCAPTPLQIAVKDALDAAAKEPNGVPAAVQSLNKQFGANARSLANALHKKFGVTASHPEGGYFLVCDVSATKKTDVEFCAMLAKQHGVVAVPMQVFFPGTPVTNLVRFAICKTETVIDRAVKAILQ